MTVDRRFQVWINNSGRLSVPSSASADYDKWYVQLDQSMFGMCQFQETHNQGINANHLHGRRFFEANNTDEHVGYAPNTNTVDIRYSVHTAHNSASDMSRHRSIVFSTDLSVKSELNSEAEATRKRWLVDYAVNNNTEFSYVLRQPVSDDPYDTDVSAHYLGHTSTVSEPLPSARVYASTNPSAGRWQELRSSAPLYRFEVRAAVKCWSYARNINS